MGIGSYLFGGDATKGLDVVGANSQYGQDILRKQLDSLGGRVAPQAQAATLGPAAQLDQTQANQARGQMQDLASRLTGIATGNAPGAGEMAINRQTGQALANQDAMARMGRGAGAALAGRNAMRNSADIGVNAAGQAAIAQRQDQDSANAMLGNTLGTMRGQDLGAAGQNAQLAQQRMLQQGAFQQQANMGNAAMRQQQMSMNDAARQNYLAQLLGIDQQQFQNQMGKNALAMQDKGIFPGLLQAGGGVLAAYAGRPGGGGGGGGIGGPVGTDPLNTMWRQQLAGR